MKPQPNLSATRGNQLGIGIFKLLLSCGGYRISLLLAKAVTWFYAQFDRTAFNATKEYLMLRFPGDAKSDRKLKRHFHRQIYELAKMLIVAHWTGSGRQVPLEEIDSKNLPAEGGVVVVLAHCDCWQASMPLLYVQKLRGARKRFPRPRQPTVR